MSKCDRKCYFCIKDCAYEKNHDRRKVHNCGNHKDFPLERKW